jgi:Rps23 Pro-64 3,4-dihydroxylase Tpa1-like proline 4-hydroxylase|tara:strand:- start:1125 stop:1658 length:534 start_codon:yes stop_codon:yes gene_type:complete
MKLVYTIPNKLWWIQDFLEYNMYKGIHNAIIRERKKINLHSVEKDWVESLYNNLEPAKRVEVKNYPPFEKLKTLVKHNQYYQLPELNHICTTIHYMTKNSGINWHDDGKWKYGATYYLNRRWNIHWGGEFMFADEKAHGFLPIIGNSLVIVKAPMDHKVNPVLSKIMPRISVQMFMK